MNKQYQEQAIKCLSLSVDFARKSKKEAEKLNNQYKINGYKQLSDYYEKKANKYQRLAESSNGWFN